MRGAQRQMEIFKRTARAIRFVCEDLGSRAEVSREILRDNRNFGLSVGLAAVRAWKPNTLTVFISRIRLSPCSLPSVALEIAIFCAA